jgi:diaminopimelate dehydrogenase
MTMSIPIRIAITGYGNLGRGAEAAITQSPDLELVAWSPGGTRPR